MTSDITVFSPLPPDKTDIARHTVRILPFLASKFYVTIVTNTENPDVSLPQGVTIRHWENISGQELAHGLNIFQIGNNAKFHGWILDAMEHTQGVCILHDLYLLELLKSHYMDGNGVKEKMFLRTVASVYGENVAMLVQLTKESSALFETLKKSFSFIPTLDTAALGYLVHSHSAAECVTRVSTRAVTEARLPLENTIDLKSHHKRDETPSAKVCVFGHLATNRRLGEFLVAISEIDDIDIIVNVFGSILDEEVYETIAKLTSERIAINIHGFVPEPVLDAYISESDVSYCFRNPSVGEASSSVIRSLVNGTVPIVPIGGWYDELPREMVEPVELNAQSECFRDIVRRSYNERHEFNRRGKKAQVWAEKWHSCSQFCENLGALVSYVDVETVNITQKVKDMIGGMIGEYEKRAGFSPGRFEDVVWDAMPFAQSPVESDGVSVRALQRNAARNQKGIEGAGERSVEIEGRSDENDCDEGRYCGGVAGILVDGNLERTTGLGCTSEASKTAPHKDDCHGSGWSSRPILREEK